MQENYIKEIIKLAKKAERKDEVPVGAIIVKNEIVISRGYNQKKSKKSVISHAEINAIVQAAKKLGDWRLENCELYVTLKPCSMCMEVIKQSRISKIYYLVDSLYNNEKSREIVEKKIENADFYGNKYKELLSSFFSSKR